MDKFECLKLEHQLCFPLYVCSKEIVRRYKPCLDELNLTYTQYIVMLVLWEHESMNVKELGRRLFLDSGTLTPVLKKLEMKGYITRQRSLLDERNLMITITDQGMALREKAVFIPEKMKGCSGLEVEELKTLSGLLSKILTRMNADREKTDIGKEDEHGSTAD